MASINIPENAVSFLRKLTELPDDVFAALASVLEGSRPSLTPKALLAQISETLKNYTPKDISEIASTLFIQLSSLEDAGTQQDHYGCASTFLKRSIVEHSLH